MARSYTASPLFQLAPRKRRISACKAREIKACISLWVQISQLALNWARGSWGTFQYPKAW